MSIDVPGTPGPARLVSLRAVILLVMGVAAALAYWPGLHGGYIFDDFPNLVNAEGWRLPALDAAGVAEVLRSDISGAIGRPLAVLSFALNHVAAGDAPFPIKLTNLLMHLLNGVLVFVLCQQLLALGSGASPTRRCFAAGVIALAWVLHPLQVSTVLYAIQRMEIGAQMGVLASLVGYVAARTRQAGGRRAWPWFAFSVFGMALGLGFKESALLAPAFALLIEALLFGFAGHGPGRSKLGIGLWAAATVAAIAVFAFVVLPDALDSSTWDMRGFTASQRLWTQLPVLAMYLGQILLPLPESMVFYYDHLQAATSPLEPRVLLASALVAALAALAIVAWRRGWRLTALGIGWFFVAHALTSNVIPLELAFEHRNYLALLGPLLALYDPLSRLLSRLHSDAAITTAMLVPALLFCLCLVQSVTWADPFGLAWTLATRNPASARANYALGKELYLRAGGDPSTPQWGLAERLFRAAAGLPGTSALPEQALIIMATTRGEAIDPAIWTSLRAKLLDGRPAPGDIESLHSLVACRMAGTCRVPDREMLDLLQAVHAAHPSSTPVVLILANFTWNVMADRPGAITLLRERHRQYPGNAPVGVALVRFLLASNLHGELEEARRILQSLEGGREPRIQRELDALSAEIDHVGVREPDGGPSTRTGNEGDK